jgi:hypothetical protein
MKSRCSFLVCASAIFLGKMLFPVVAAAQPVEAARSSEPDQVLAAVNSPAANQRYAHEISPIFETHCVSCHSGPRPTGDLVLKFKDEKEVRQKAAGDRDFWSRVAGMLTSQEMPPSDAPTRLSDAERELLLKWIYSDVLSIDCNAGPTPGRFRVGRLNNREYANTVRDLLYLPADWDASADFPADERGVGFDNNSDTLTISPVLIEHYIKAAEKSVNFAMNNHGQGSRESQRQLNAPREEYREDFADWQAEARVVIELFAPRAFRRPVTKQEIDELMRFAAVSFAHDGESIDAASSLAMRAALMSPNFLFRFERDPSADGSSKVFQISEFELASRLSYFLWASMPDDELGSTAREGKLRATLDDQVRRMLKHPKSISLTKDFAGQWLEIRGVLETTNCPPELLAAMQGETEHFFNYIVQEDRSIMDFLDADYTFLNETLAQHYGIGGVAGDKFRRVEVDTTQRGGIFTHASFLTLTGKPLGESRRTSPVNRGKWILENIFDTTIPPPPPDVPALAIDFEQELKGTVRQIFEQHRADPKCASCHARMDPYGFALENYDGFGAWRKQDNQLEVDASGEIDGQKFTTPKEFRAILAARKEQFRRALVVKLLQYALGRGIEDFDKCAIDEICAAVEEDGDRFSSVILNLVHSVPFQYSRGSEISQEQLLAAEQGEAKARAEALARAEAQALVNAEAKAVAEAQRQNETESRAQALYAEIARLEAKLHAERLESLEQRSRARAAAQTVNAARTNAETAAEAQADVYARTQALYPLPPGPRRKNN